MAVFFFDGILQLGVENTGKLKHFALYHRYI